MNPIQVLTTAGVTFRAGDKWGPESPPRFEVVFVPGEEALRAWKALRKSTGETSFWPVIVGETSVFESYSEGSRKPNWRDIESTLSEAKGIDLSDWREKRIAEAEEDAEWEDEEEEAYFEPPRGPWPDSAAQTEPSCHKEITTGLPLKEVAIALLPNCEPWEAPALLQFGGWNECPFPEAIVAHCRHWNSGFGAEVLAITSDTIELSVERPVSTRESATDLALEQFVFCDDIVHQGTETIERLAAELLDSRCWFFWWD